MLGLKLFIIFQGFSSIDPVIRLILHTACRISGEGFSDMTEDDVHELLDSRDEVPSDEDLIEISQIHFSN